MLDYTEKMKKRQTHRLRDTQTDTQTDTHTDRQTHRQIQTQTHYQVNKQINRLPLVSQETDLPKVMEGNQTPEHRLLLSLPSYELEN